MSGSIIGMRAYDWKELDFFIFANANALKRKETGISIWPFWPLVHLRLYLTFTMYILTAVSDTVQLSHVIFYSPCIMQASGSHAFGHGHSLTLTMPHQSISFRDRVMYPVICSHWGCLFIQYTTKVDHPLIATTT